MIGETISHYRIIEKLGGGGMGVVYRAEDTRLGRDVALKFLPPELTRDPEARERFTLEARAASALDHANICTIYDIDETTDGRLFIAMGFYSGATLKARLATGGIEIDEAVSIARQIAAGLERAHRQGIIHRDIKPANLMITEHGEVRILDFGVAKLAGEAGLTRTGSTLGTLAYMAPEQVQGSDVGPTTDLWALGVVLYQMLTGSLPFAGRGETETVAAILALDPEPPGARRGDTPAALETLTLDLLRKDPAERPSSGAEVVARLDELARPVELVPAPSLLHSPVTWVVAAGTVVLLAAVLVLPARGRARVAAARATLSRVDSLVREGRYSAAYALALETERVLGEDTTLDRLVPELSDIVTVRSEPGGAAVHLATVEDAGAAAIGAPTLLGRTPIVGARVPRGDQFLTIELDGYAPVERLASSRLARGGQGGPTRGSTDIVLDIRLLPTDSVPPGMVHVPAGPYTLVSADAPAGATADLDEFFIDRFEVTNAEYREFIRAGGYADPALWTGSQGAPAVARGVFRDRTGLPAPRDWTGQQFPQGLDRHPVTSVSWYEAAAYCRWRGGALPTLFEWEKAARGGTFSRAEGFVLPWGLVEPGQATGPRANFEGRGTVEVDARPLGLSPFGAHAMAGNVREWTANTAERGIIAMGGSWQDPVYLFPAIATPEASSATPSLGFRCVRRAGTPEAHGAGRIELARRSPSYRPVDEAAYRSFLAHYRYDPVELAPETLESVDTEDWTRLKIAFQGVAGDRILAYLYLPHGAAPPYQTMVFVPGAAAFFADPLDHHVEWLLGANIRSGRAALAVVLDGMVERQWPPGTAIPASNTVGFRDLMVRHATELSVGLDYLETRDDMDMDRLAYVGLS